MPHSPALHLPAVHHSATHQVDQFRAVLGPAHEEATAKGRRRFPSLDIVANDMERLDPLPVVGQSHRGVLGLRRSGRAE